MMMKHRHNNNKKKKREGFSLFGWLLLGASALVAVHIFKSYQAASVDPNGIAGGVIVAKKKKKIVEGLSLGGGSKNNKDLRQQAYYANLAMSWQNMQGF
jgi:hypothetical protein